MVDRMNKEIKIGCFIVIVLIVFLILLIIYYFVLLDNVIVKVLFNLMN